MTHCALCDRPMGKAGNGNERVQIVCATCNSKNESETRRAEDRYWREMRETFENATRGWAMYTLEREQ